MAKDKQRIIEAEWQKAFQELAGGTFFRLLSEGLLTLAHYVGFLRESYYNTRRNPKTMALFIAHLPPTNAALEARFLKHAAMEFGHDALALEDLRKLGIDSRPVTEGRPLPATEAMSGFIGLQIQQGNPLAYLGYSYHLETLPIRMAQAGFAALGKLGIPPEAMSFLREHAEVDPVHMQWNLEYLEGLVRTEKEFEGVLYGLRGTCELHGAMFEAILRNVERETSWSQGAPVRVKAT